MPVRIYFQSWGRLSLVRSFSSSPNQWQGKEGVGLQDGFGREGGLEVMLRIGGDTVLSKASL